MRQLLDDTLNRLMYQTDHFFTAAGVADPRLIAVPETTPDVSNPVYRAAPPLSRG